MTILRSFVLLSGMAALACSDNDLVSTTAQPSQSQADSAATLVMQDLAHSAVPVCRTTGAPPLNGSAVRVTSRLCLSCKSIGYLLRTLASDRPTHPVFIVMPDDHTDSVCDFLKQERVKIPVFAISEDPHIPRLLSNSILVVEFDSTGNHASVAGKDAVRLLAQLGR